MDKMETKWRQNGDKMETKWGEKWRKSEKMGQQLKYGQDWKKLKERSKLDITKFGQNHRV